MIEEEVDLKDLYNVFKKTTTYYFIDRTLSFIIKNNIWFILFLLIGGGYGYYKSSQKLPVYKSDMVIDSRHLNNLSCEEIVNSLKVIIAENNTVELNNIGFEPDVASKILSINFIYPQTVVSDSIFKIEVQTHDNNNFKAIESNIFNYIKNNDYSVANKTTKEKYLTNQKQELLKSKEIIDSLLNATQQNNGKDIDLSSLLVEKIAINQQLITIDNELELVEGIHLIRGLTPKINPEKQRDFSILIYAFLAFIIGGILLRLIKRK